MPVRSLTSPVLRWPDAEAVRRAAEAWAEALVETEPQVVAIGYFGSYARGDAGAGSDLDLVVVVRESALPFERRAARWPLESLPVPADLLVYTTAEWCGLAGRSPRFARALHDETHWLIGSQPPG
jgi:predicted nucleotidyltransferase